MSNLFRRDPAPVDPPAPTVDRREFLRRPPRCDRCPADARVLVASPTMSRRADRTPWRPVLSFCSHDYREHGPLLSLRGWTVEVDTRGDLVWAEDGRLRDPRPGHPRSDPPR